MGKLTIDNVAVEDFGLKVIKYEVLALPSINAKETKIAGRDGVVVGDTTLNAGQLKIEFSVMENAMQNVMDNIRKFIVFLDPRTNVDKAFKFTDDPNVVRFACLENSEQINKLKGKDASIADFTLTFKMRDPFVYSDLITDSRTVSCNGTYTIANTDALETYPIIKLKVPYGVVDYAAGGIGTTNPGGQTLSHISVYIGSTKVTYTGSIRDDEELIIDTENMTMTKSELYVSGEDYHTHYKHDSASLTYVGSWTPMTNEVYYYGTAEYAAYTDTSKSVSLTFNGTGVSLRAIAGHDSGVIRVTLDGQDYFVDPYDDGPVVSKIIFEKHGLTNGSHTIKIAPAGIKNTNAQAGILVFEEFIAYTPGYASYRTVSAMRYWEDEFPRLEKGNNTIKVVDNTGIGADIVLEYRKRWM